MNAYPTREEIAAYISRLNRLDAEKAKTKAKKNQGDNKLICPKCGRMADKRGFDHIPDWGYVCVLCWEDANQEMEGLK